MHCYCLKHTDIKKKNKLFKLFTKKNKLFKLFTKKKKEKKKKNIYIYTPIKQDRQLPSPQVSQLLSKAVHCTHE